MKDIIHLESVAWGLPRRTVQGLEDSLNVVEEEDRSERVALLDADGVSKAGRCVSNGQSDFDISVKRADATKEPRWDSASA